VPLERTQNWIELEGEVNRRIPGPFIVMIIAFRRQWRDDPAANKSAIEHETQPKAARQFLDAILFLNPRGMPDNRLVA
jgi:hypothetical protein